MPFTIVDMLYGGVVPAVVALIVWFTARRVLPEEAASRCAASLALGIGFSAAYWLVWWKEEHGYWLPRMPYDWLAVVIAVAAVIGPVVHARGVSWVERLLTYAVFGLVAAWFLLPTRASVQPLRPVYAVSLGPALALIAMLFDGVCERWRGPLLPGMLVFAAMCTSAILLLSGSTGFSLTAGAGAGALTGIAVAMCRTREATFRGASLACCTLLGGAMLVGQFNTISQVPLASYVIPPVAPLLLWAGVRGPLSQGNGAFAGMKRIAIAAAACCIAVGLAAMESLGGGE
jgi:hypothetical protein